MDESLVVGEPDQHHAARETIRLRILCCETSTYGIVKFETRLVGPSDPF